MLCTRVRGIATPALIGRTASHIDRPTRTAELIAERRGIVSGGRTPCRHTEPGQPTAVGRQCAASRPGAGAKRLARRDIPATPIGGLRRITNGSARAIWIMLGEGV